MPSFSSPTSTYYPMNKKYKNLPSSHLLYVSGNLLESSEWPHNPSKYSHYSTQSTRYTHCNRSMSSFLKYKELETCCFVKNCWTITASVLQANDRLMTIDYPWRKILELERLVYFIIYIYRDILGCPSTKQPWVHSRYSIPAPPCQVVSF